MVCGREETEELYGGQQPAISRHSLAGDAQHACSRTTHGGHPSQVPPLSQHQAPTKFAATLQVSHSASACGHTGSSSVPSHASQTPLRCCTAEVPDAPAGSSDVSAKAGKAEPVF